MFEKKKRGVEGRGESKKFKRKPTQPTRRPKRSSKVCGERRGKEGEIEMEMAGEKGGEGVG